MQDHIITMFSSCWNEIKIYSVSRKTTTAFKHKIASHGDNRQVYFSLYNGQVYYLK